MHYSILENHLNWLKKSVRNWKGLFASYMERPVEMSMTCVTSCFVQRVCSPSSFLPREMPYENIYVLLTIKQPPGSGRENGWKIVNGQLKIDWNDLPLAPDAVLELLSCSCNKECANNRCSCFNNGLLCTDVCNCTDVCENKQDLTMEESDPEDEED